MLIRSEYDIQFHLPQPTPFIAMLHVHPSLEERLAAPDHLKVEHIGPADQRPGTVQLAIEEYVDSFGNCCSRFTAPAGAIRLSGSNIINADDNPDPQGFGVGQEPVERLPAETLQFLLASRYCQVDQFVGIAQDP
jgi:hypothetical protein